MDAKAIIVFIVKMLIACNGSISHKLDNVIVEFGEPLTLMTNMASANATWWKVERGLRNTLRIPEPFIKNGMLHFGSVNHSSTAIYNYFPNVPNKTSDKYETHVLVVEHNCSNLNFYGERGVILNSCHFKFINFSGDNVDIKCLGVPQEEIT